jgi:pimeloyl-ACP methyl ester carboxylesterase
MMTIFMRSVARGYLRADKSKQKGKRRMAGKLGRKLAIGYIRARLNMLAMLSPRKAAERALRVFSTPYHRSRKQMPQVFTQAESLQLNLGGTTLQGYRWNHPAPRKLLLVHGFESTVFNFERYVTPFVKRGYEVLAFDAPAHGRSGGRTITLPEYVRMLELINRTYGPLDAFIAHSFGGLAVSQFLERHPHGSDMKVVLIAPATETSTAVRFFMDFLRLTEPTRKAFLELIAQKAGVDPAYFSVTRAAPSIRAQVLWAHDEEDDVTPFADTLPVREAGYPNFRFLVTRGLGHRRIYRDNAVRQAIISFLDPGSDGRALSPGSGE